MFTVSRRFALALSLSLVPGLTAAQSTERPDSLADSTRKITKLAPISVTATRTEQLTFRTANPVLVTDQSVVREESPNGIQDLFRNLPGVDVTGVGPNQGRIMIRGERGQRILLLENGVRINNSRRQQDFGELPALTDINDVSRVEVVRGPGSVLYGTDAIGGVVNQLTQPTPGRSAGNGMRGSLGYRYGSAATQSVAHGRVEGRLGAFGFAASAAWRDAAAYAAPAGSFGNLELDQRTLVQDSGVLDRNLAVALGWDVGDHSALSLRVNRYEARDAGFGYVRPADLGEAGGATVRILYPTQNVTRVTAAWTGSALGWAIADRATLTGWSSENDRVLDIDVTVPFGAPLPPTAGIHSYSRNFTDIRSSGARAELVKVLGAGHILTWGADLFVDRSNNTDSSQTTVTVFGPPQVRTSTRPSVPNAGYRSVGLFGQLELAALDKLTMTGGVRGQLSTAWTRETEGLTAPLTSTTDGTVVGAVNAQYAVAPTVHLVAGLGRAFRAPNLVERFFEGPTPEGSGYQVASPDLQPETSLNLDLGVKVRTGRIRAELFTFRNTIRNGIRIAPHDSTIGPFPAFGNVNVDRLRTRGVEFLGEVDLTAGFSLLGHYSWLSSKNVEADNPVGDGYSSKVGGELAWRDGTGRFFAAWEIRHQGERDDVEIGESPVGDVLPAFTVHNARVGMTLPEFAGTRAQLGVSLLNLTNRLYAEASNTSFFRPEPRRSAVVSLRLDF